jgi:hypothetical protein
MAPNLRRGLKALDVGCHGAGMLVGLLAHFLGSTKSSKGHAYGLAQTEEQISTASTNLQPFVDNKHLLPGSYSFHINSPSKGLPEFAPYDRTFSYFIAL